ncbi:MFS transporter [Pandoraea sp. ISTKB]|uniref:MFS transporter n=1 Tax=Pandoraea sp. ISTKB TaxID=1586708 RepID=UPI0008464316|nr:MFS transporter [Pandoraea sp. ISTKB]ODP32947.1 MFS transporter [Pandoraea sp. ISTKB]
MSGLTANRNVLRLSFAQALAGANSTVVYATAAIIGHMLSPDPALATLPISVFVLGMAMSTLPVGAITKRHGRVAAFLVGNACGVGMGLLAAIALIVHSFALFTLAMIFGGAYAAVVLTFRFAAAECVAAHERPKALSTVLAGGVAAGVLGPQLVTGTMNAWPPHAYVVTYLMAAVVALGSAIVLAGGKFDAHRQPAHGGARNEGRPVSEFLRDPRLLVAMLCGVVTYTLMNFMMTSAPLAMELCGIARQHANFGIELHVIAMYAPSFFTGRLITRFGAHRIVLLGLALTACAAFAGMAGLSVGHFWLALVLLGLGWNFGFLGASAMVLTCHTPEEGPRVQSVNDFVVFGAMVVGSFASGSLLTSLGWTVIAELMLPPLVIGVMGVVWLQWSRARKQRAVTSCE